ncbi:MAG: ATP-binding cassette domain-containing protein [Holosporales bacterium]|jgi:phospholipid/cholesterol/gamma-HCH transport system ATP-binding protein|nr:ATP-binding cassette domain-containing protein [Holosporales bacterium]
MLYIKGLQVHLNGRNVLDGIDLELQKGESLVILGESGVGKSVLLKSVLGIVPIVTGSIVINGVDVVTAEEEERAQALSSIGMLFQGCALFDSLPIWENVAFGLIYGKHMDISQAKEIALAKMSLVNLDSSVADLTTASLSGGMQKRVALARALALDPQIIFFDEPTTGLDPITSNVVNKLINSSVKERGIGAITITHDINCLRQIADSVAFLRRGKIIWRGTVCELDSVQDDYVYRFMHA